MEQMKTFKQFLKDNPNFWNDIEGDDDLSLDVYFNDEVVYYGDRITFDIEQYYAYYYVNRSYDEMVHFFRLQARRFMQDGWGKLIKVYQNIDVNNLLYEFLRESNSDGKNWNRNRPLNLLNDETSATSTNGFANTLLDKGYNKNQVSQFKKLVEDFRNIYKAYIYSFGYLFCEVF